jgi:hypothetical protein
MLKYVQTIPIPQLDSINIPTKLSDEFLSYESTLLVAKILSTIIDATPAIFDDPAQIRTTSKYINGGFTKNPDRFSKICDMVKFIIV